MSDPEEERVADSTAHYEEAGKVISIPRPSDEAEGSDVMPEQDDEVQELTTESEENVERHSEFSLSTPKSDDSKPREEVTSLGSASGSQDQDYRLLDYQKGEDDELLFLHKIKAIKETLQTSVRESIATVKIVLIPAGQEIIMPFRVDAPFRFLKEHFAHLLHIPHYVLQITHEGIIVGNNESLIQYGIKPQEIVQVEVFSTLPDQYPVRRIEGLSEGSQIITVTIQTSIDRYEEVAVEIIKSDFHKPFLGGFRHKITGLEYHNAGTQTVPRKIPEKDNLFCRDTQTVFQKKKLQQTTNTTSTQMTKIGVYVSNMTDKLLKPGNYFSAAEYHARRLHAVIVIQTSYRRWHAKRYVESLRKQKKLRLEWEEEQELLKIQEKEEWIRMDYYRRHNPKTTEDFELLYNALELWRQEEVEQICHYSSEAERKAALCELLEKETQMIASIGRHRSAARMERQDAAIQAFLDKCSAPNVWRRGDGKTIEMDTQFTIRARELQSIYKCILLKDLSQDERLDILLTLKHTVKEHECKLTQEILELIDREVDLMMRGVKPHNLEGLRKRITTLFIHYIKTPLFNPEVAKYLKVPQDPLKFYDTIYFCHSCQNYLPSVEFSVSPTSHRVYRCRHCINLENETQRRESFLKYKCLLQRLYYSEADYGDNSQIAFLMQLQDIKYLTENIWASQSALSAWDDLNDLVMVRWDKHVEWSPWNCILLTKDESTAHLRLPSIEKGYGHHFVHKIKHKHILAKNYFSQIPTLASLILNDDEVEDIRSKHSTKSPPKIIITRRIQPH
ncbi:IQ and ubiquitin-like domain-containing protein [Mus musculus]|uniref:IQ motif and ubiquitin-like domain-containing protein n=2 Tax=Mus musculus TaxID=10090 RepID=IQUB_MOUSE|nr:IQ and ubiquitin-like domain-containing protein [Mus musculus]Q8CDK3.2 RecName: Full=IQ and ubiquitin-like domain-containing protein [Mus musculus]AAI37938.1 IQ motif and ubiquitin domain containing [Mus musculus]AAI37958.1 IQ motif and ubiquitin domain containing [Mus musculus]|eukprot:NP_766123.2 IQ and ubiquitin-like domain-containing protein [Mus musculus]